MFRRIDDKVSVWGQLLPDQVRDAAADGIRMIVNNRPDGEQPGQPLAREIEAAAAEAGIAYRHIPVAGGFSAAQVEATAEALESTDGRVLAFCASGTRSTYLWALARAKAGDAADDIIGKAAAAGYDLTPLKPHLG